MDTLRGKIMWMKMAIYMPKRDACKQEKNKECHSSSSYIRFRHNHCSHDSVARMKIQEETLCVLEKQAPR